MLASRISLCSSFFSLSLVAVCSLLLSIPSLSSSSSFVFFFSQYLAEYLPPSFTATKFMDLSFSCILFDINHSFFLFPPLYLLFLLVFRSHSLLFGFSLLFIFITRRSYLLPNQHNRCLSLCLFSPRSIFDIFFFFLLLSISSSFLHPFFTF